MPTSPIILIGGGGHAKVVIDALLKLGRRRSDIRLLDESLERVGKNVLGVVIEEFDPTTCVRRSFHVCVGDNAARARLVGQLSAAGGLPTTVVHPGASIAEGTSILDGCFIAAGAVVGPEVQIGASSIINHNAVVDHDSSVGSFTHVAPGATLGGNCRVAAGTLIGAGANLRPGVSVGEYCIVGVGAVVTRSLPANAVFVGVPARRLR